MRKRAQQLLLRQLLLLLLLLMVHIWRRDGDRGTRGEKRGVVHHGQSRNVLLVVRHERGEVRRDGACSEELALDAVVGVVWGEGGGGDEVVNDGAQLGAVVQGVGGRGRRGVGHGRGEDHGELVRDGGEHRGGCVERAAGGGRRRHSKQGRA